MTRDKLLTVLSQDFAILGAIGGGWVLFVLSGSGTHFADLTHEDNLIKLTVGIVAWIVLYLQHVRVSGSWENPPDPATLTRQQRERLRAYVAALPPEPDQPPAPPLPVPVVAPAA